MRPRGADMVTFPSGGVTRPSAYASVCREQDISTGPLTVVARGRTDRGCQMSDHAPGVVSRFGYHGMVLCSCAPTPRDGAGFRLGCQAPDAIIIDAQERLRRLSLFYGGASIVVFIRGARRTVSAKLDVATARLVATVAVINVCTGPAESCFGCRQGPFDDSRRPLRLCDLQGVLARRYSVRDGSALFVLDQHGKAQARGTLDHLDRLCEWAEGLAEAAERSRAIDGPAAGNQVSACGASRC